MKKTAIAAAAATLLAGHAASQQRALTVVSWGGAYARSQIEAYHKPFTAATGIHIRSENYDGNVAPIRPQVRANKVVWDIVDVELADAVRLCNEGLLEKIDTKILAPGADGKPAVEDFFKGTLHECAVATVIWSTVYGYDKSTFTGGKPATMVDFFDTQKFPGKRGLRKTPKNNLEFALMADGVAASHVYQVLRTKEGIARAFGKLDGLKQHIVWWQGADEPPHMLGDGQVVMTTAFNGRLFDAALKDNSGLTIVWDGQIWDIDVWVLPKGSRNKQAALEFLKFSTTTQALADQTKWISYAPSRRSSIPLVGKFHDNRTEMGPHMPTAPANFRNAVQNDYMFWAEKHDELTKEFNAWLAR